MARVQFLCVAYLNQCIQFSLSNSSIPNSFNIWLSFLFGVFLCICLYQIEQVLVTVISPLPSDELVIHIKMESIYTCWLCIVYYITHYVNLSVKSADLLPQHFICSQSFYWLFSPSFAHLLSLMYTNCWKRKKKKAFALQKNKTKKSVLQHHQIIAGQGTGISKCFCFMVKLH